MKIKTIILSIVCIGIATLTQAQSMSAPLKNGKKIILAIDNETKTVVDILPADALTDKTIAAKKYPGSTFLLVCYMGNPAVRYIRMSTRISKKDHLQATAPKQIPAQYGPMSTRISRKGRSSP